VKRLFGTDGIRGAAGEFPLDDATVARLGRALPHILKARDGLVLRVVIGRDTRESSPAIEAALKCGIEEAGGHADCGGVLSTPAVACVARELGYDAGIVVSASHNPYHDNGIKIFSSEGYKLPDAVEMQIEAEVLEGTASADATVPAGDGAGHGGDLDIAHRYLDYLRGTIAPGTSFAGWTIVLDCANGAVSQLGPELFANLGAQVVTLNAAPDGRNINEGCGTLHPEALAAEVVRRGARLGLAFDGDADRCLLVDGSGRVLDGDYIVYLAAIDLKRSGRLAGDTVVGTVMTNLWLEHALEAEGIRIVRAPVGDKYVLEEMQAGGFVLGGEQSGHIIFLERATTGDGLLTGLQIVDLLARTGLDLAAWSASVQPCPQILINVPVRERPTLETHPRIGPAIRDEEQRLGRSGRLVVRYSGTEPKARIMVEAESRQTMEECAERLRHLIEQEIGRKVC
jgi:phosphoglucosamine mutase